MKIAEMALFHLLYATWQMASQTRVGVVFNLSSTIDLSTPTLYYELSFILQLVPFTAVRHAPYVHKLVTREIVYIARLRSAPPVEYNVWRSAYDNGTLPAIVSWRWR